MTLGKSKIFLLFCVSFLAGVALGQYLNFQIMAIEAVIFLILLSVWWSDKRLVLIGFLGLVFLGGALRYQASMPDPENFIGRFYGQEVELEGVMIREPDVRSDKTNLTLKPTSLPHPSPLLGKERGLVGNILLNVGKYPEYQYGDKLKISGKLEQPFESEEFSYRDYLSRFDVYAVMTYPRVEKLATGQGNPLKASLLGLKAKFQSVLSQVLPEPHNAFALGLILGLKRSLPEDLKAALIAVGVSHIVVVSGYNMSLITKNLVKTRIFWGRRIAFMLSLVVVLGFVVITGGEG